MWFNWVKLGIGSICETGFYIEPLCHSYWTGYSISESKCSIHESRQVYVRTYIHTYIQAYKRKCMHTCMHTCIHLFIYLLHLFTQGKPKQLTLVFIGALHSFHIVTNMYVQNRIQYSQIARTWRILKHYIYNIIQIGLQGHVNTMFYDEVLVWTRSNKLLFVIVEASRSTWLHHLQQNSWRSNSVLQKEWSVPYESIVSFHEYV